jgi:hypothetical protein
MIFHYLFRIRGSRRWPIRLPTMQIILDAPGAIWKNPGLNLLLHSEPLDGHAVTVALLVLYIFQMYLVLTIFALESKYEPDYSLSSFGDRE